MAFDEALVPRALFGGAIALALPARFQDVSDFRPVPDNQEVFADASTDQSVIVEVLERHASLPDASAARFFFLDLAEEGSPLEPPAALEPGPNDAAVAASADAGPTWRLEEARLADARAVCPLLRLPAAAGAPPPPSPPLGLAAGELLASKGRQDASKANVVRLFLAVVRLEAYASELLVTMNAPTFINPASAAAKDTEGAGNRPEAQAAGALFTKILATLDVKDYGLFGV